MKCWSTLAFIAVVALQACGGSGGTAPIVAPSAPAGGAPASKTKTTVLLTITIPAKQTSSARRPAYVSVNTQSLSIQQLAVSPPYSAVGKPVVVNVTPSSPGCTTGTSGTTCSVSFAASPGTFNFSIQSFAGTSASGALLAENTLTTMTIVAGVANQISVTLNADIASIVLPAPVAVTRVYAQTFNFSLQDASGATIVGSGSFDNGPLVVTDISGLVSLSPSSFSSAAGTLAVTMQCSTVGPGELQFSDANGSLGTLNYNCLANSIALSPGSLDFDALAANQSDPTYDQIVTASDTNANVTSQNTTLSCTPGAGAKSSTIALVVAELAPDTWGIRPLDVGTCTFFITDYLSGGSSQASQAIAVELHTTNYVIQSRPRRGIR